MNPIVEIYRSGKPVKALYYMAAVLRSLVPGSIYRARGRRMLRTWCRRPDADYIRRRVEHYCRLQPHTPLPAQAEDLHHPDTSRGKRVYYIDLARIAAYLPKGARATFVPGDVYDNPPYPALIKARRLDAPGGENAVLLPLNRVRHFPHPHDNIPTSAKKPVLYFRGKIADKPCRIRFFEKWWGHPGLDLGDTSHTPVRPEWGAKKVSIASQFAYRFILVLEGNDVGSSLQWVMGSRCVPFMTRPRVEHWLMHSLLVPGVHYVEIADDYSDVAQKVAYYTEHPHEAEAIARASAEWYSQFADKKRELLIQLLVVDKYLSCTGQK